MHYKEIPLLSTTRIFALDLRIQAELRKEL